MAGRQTPPTVLVPVKQNYIAFDQLPNELITEIFLSGLGRDIRDKYWHDDRRFLVALLSVCTLWRELARSTPGLWTRITWEYTHPAQSPSAFDGRLLAISSYLERSGQASLSIRLHIYWEDVGDRARIWNTILPHLARCRSLWLKTRADGPLNLFFPLPGRLERLTSLDVNVVGAIHHAPLLEEQNVAPLKKLAIHHTISPFPGSMAHFRTDHLEHVQLHVGTISIAVAMKFLALCPATVKLNLSFNGMAVPNPDEIPVITLPNLKILSIMNLETYRFRKIVSAPNITELTITTGVWPIAALWTEPGSNVVSASLQTLKVLSLGSMPIMPPVDSLIDILSSNPSITSLHLHRWLGTPLILETLASSTNQWSGSPLLPDLRSLHLVSSWPTGDEDQANVQLSPLTSSLLRSRPRLQIFTNTKSVQEDIRDRLIGEFGGRLQLF